MLIIAMPKSASTSLMKTLGSLHHIRTKQSFYPNQQRPENYSCLWKYHGDMREITPEQADQFSDSDIIYKQHIPPTRKNRSLLKEVRKVILVRDPIQVVLAYFRGYRKGVHNLLPEFRGLHSQEEWLKRAKEIQLIDELTNFYHSWKFDSGEKLLITYEELIKDPTTAIQRIEEYWDWPVHEQTIQLGKKRYSRIGPAQTLWNKLYARPVKNFLSFIKRIMTRAR